MESQAATGPTSVVDGVTAGARRAGGRLYVLDVLRLGAALFVVGHHLIATLPGDWPDDPNKLFSHPLTHLFRYGWMGVEFFFVISGFVICMSCWGRSATDFFISRVSRLFPAYWFAVLLTALVLSFWTYRNIGAPGYQVVANLTMLQNFLGVDHLDWNYWTLVVELKFYLAFAIVVAFGLTYRRVVLFCIVWQTFSVVEATAGNGLFAPFAEPRYTPFFVLGIVLFLMHKFGSNALLWGIFGMACLLGIGGLNAHVKEQQALYGTSEISNRGALMLIGAFVLLMVGVAYGLFGWMRWRGFAIVGALTYPLYLMHHKIGLVLINRFRGDLPPRQLLLVLLVGFLLLSLLVHLFVERPLSKYLKRALHRSFATIRANSDARRARPPASRDGNSEDRAPAHLLTLPRPRRAPDDDGEAREIPRDTGPAGPPEPVGLGAAKSGPDVDAAGRYFGGPIRSSD